MKTIPTKRLDLISLTPPFVLACLNGDVEAARAILGIEIPEEWFLEEHLMKMRLAQLQSEPSLQPWLLRAVSVRDEGRMAGYIGFHNAPCAEYLNKISPGGVELGYTIFPQFRRKGYAMEAAWALIAWAQHEHRVERFVVSISPENIPSLHLAAKMGYQKIGWHMDPEDGPEDIFELLVQQEPGSR